MLSVSQAIGKSFALIVAVSLVTGCARSSPSGTIPALNRDDSGKQMLSLGFRPLSLRSTVHGSKRRHHHRKFAGLVAGALPDKIDPRHVPSNLPRIFSEIKVAANVGERQFSAMRRATLADGSSRTVRNVLYDPNQGGQFGLYSYQTAFFPSGTFGYQTGYEAVEISYAMPVNDLLYAPTNRGVGGSCLEIGSAYTKYAAQVYAYDFCDHALSSGGVGVFHYLFQIDGAFRATYERDYGDGLPSYLYETYYDWGTGKWAVLFFNASSGTWENRYESQTGTLDPAAQGANGWNMFETHYFADEQSNRSGACPLAFEAHSWNLQWINPSGGWQYLDTVPGLSYVYRTYDPNNQCLDADDGSGRGYYYLLDGVTLHEWYVDAYASQADPCANGCGGYPYYPPTYYYPYYPCSTGFTNRGPCALSRKRNVSMSDASRRGGAGPVSTGRLAARSGI